MLQFRLTPASTRSEQCIAWWLAFSDHGDRDEEDGEELGGEFHVWIGMVGCYDGPSNVECVCEIDA